ncbi:MAG TPA: isoprenylcysteine carboxylmethyltransferase family protein [Candidatus Binataceae bacterium]|nr:isoprenylcysteine carboxylmethyltransferase family protein [Candidatus Binataceae bacterium]
MNSEAIGPSAQPARKSTGELKAPTASLKESSAPLATPRDPQAAASRGFTVRLAELVILMAAIVGAVALGLGMSQYLAKHRYVAAYLIAYGVFRFADLLVRDQAALGLDRERFMRRVMYEIPLLVLFFAAPFERTYILEALGYSGETPRWTGALGLLIELAGLWLVLGARIQLGFFSPAPRSDARPVLVRNGLYRLIRHPIYAGELIVLLAWPFEYGAPVTLVIASIVGFIVIRDRARNEEAELLAQFGDDYAAYMNVTYSVVPNLW